MVMFMKHRARMIATKEGYAFRGNLVDIVCMMACNLMMLESMGFDVAELKHALLFLEKPENLSTEAYQEIQMEGRNCLNTMAEKEHA